MYVWCSGNCRYLSNLHLLTLAGYDYKITTSTVKFEPCTSDVQQQCLEIETINDSLPKHPEVLTLLLSTNNSAVHLNTDRVNVYIEAKLNDGKYILATQSVIHISKGVFITMYI